MQPTVHSSEHLMLQVDRDVVTFWNPLRLHCLAERVDYGEQSAYQLWHAGQPAMHGPVSHIFDW
jgi:hypothetical protein